jgi:hypothetical protein
LLRDLRPLNKWSYVWYLTTLTSKRKFNGEVTMKTYNIVKKEVLFY